METTKHEDEEETQELPYRPRPPLEKPGTYLRDIGYLINAMKNDEIDVNPEYQREVVWTADRMSQLIDSLMENFYIPPIILNRQTNRDTRKSILVCVDGKQRLSSVKAFVQGIIPCQDHRGEKWWFSNAHVQGRNKNVLTEAAQREFLNKDFVTFEYTDLRPEQEEDLFARVQMGMPLSAAERMRAQTGPWQELARHFCNDFPLIYSLQKDRMRAKDFQLTLSCFSQIVEVQNPTPTDGIPLHKANHNHLPKLLKKTGSIDDDLKSHLASVWKTLQDLIELDPDTFTNADKRLKGVQTFAPVEMVAVTVLISLHAETRTDRLLLEDIRSLRDDLRANFNDLRMNNYLWKAIWSFIQELDKIRPAGEDTSVRVQSGPRSPPLRSARVLAASGPKMGRLTARIKSPTFLPGAARDNRIAVKPEPTENTGCKVYSDTSTTGITNSDRPFPASIIEAEAVPSEPRPRKRQRIGSYNSSTAPQASAASPALLWNAQDMALQPTPCTAEARALSPFASLGASVATSIPTKARQQPTQSLTSTSRNMEKQASTKEFTIAAPPTNSLPTPGSTPPFMPAEARQNRRSSLDGYRAPIAPMGLGLTSGTSVLVASSRATPALFGQAPRPSNIQSSVHSNSEASTLSKKRCTQPNKQGFHQSPTKPRRPWAFDSGPIRLPTQTQKLVAIAPSAPVPAAKASRVASEHNRDSTPQYEAVIDLTNDEPEAIEKQP